MIRLPLLVWNGCNSVSDQEVAKRINSILAVLRPNVQMDGGDIELIKFQSGKAYIRMLGACIGCPMASFTVKAGIEQALKEQIPDVEEVIPIEGHDEMSLVG